MNPQTATESPRTKVYKFPELVIHKKRSAALASQAPALSVDTNGWDTVYAIPASAANKAIARANQQMSFDQSVSGVSSSAVHGTFGPWQLTNDGDGHLIGIKAPITTGTMVFNGTPYQLGGAELLFTVELEAVPQPAKAAQTGGSGKQVALKVRSGKRAVAAQSVQPVQAVDLIWPNAPLEPAPSIAKGLLEQWMNNNVAQFNHVFAVVSVSDKADTGAFAWLKPSEVGYGFAPAASGDGVFAVLTTTGSRSSTGLPHAVSASAIPAGAPSGFVISSERFLSDMILPGLPAAYPKAPEGAFAMTGDTQISNVKEFAIEFEAAGSKYSGTLKPNSLTYTIAGTQLVIEIAGMEVNYSAGIDVILDFKEFLTVGVKKRDDGTSMIFLTQTELKVDHSVVQAEWVQGLTIAADIIAGMIGSAFGMWGSLDSFVAAGLTRASAWAWAILCGVIVGGLLNVVTNAANYINLIADGKFESIPAIEAMLGQGIGEVEWPDSSGWKLVSAGLAKSWQLGLDPGLS